MGRFNKMATSHDIPLLISSPNASSERRVSPSWSIAQLKTRLEPITGIPASAQRLKLGDVSLDSHDEETTILNQFQLQPYAELQVIDTRPPSLQTNFSDLSKVDKYVMPTEDYETRTDSVLAWKKTQKLGRFDPNAPSMEEQKIQAIEREVEERNIKVGSRCALLPTSDSRRGTIRFIGPIAQIPGTRGPWIGIVLDEPTGKNDGTVDGVRFFECPPKCGVFVRPERVEVGDFPALDDLGEEFEEM